MTRPDYAAHQYAQLLLVEVLRAALASPKSFPISWLRAYADPQLAPALRRMRAEPGRRRHLKSSPLRVDVPHHLQHALPLRGRRAAAYIPPPDGGCTSPSARSSRTTH
ncbi:hypothetical protein ACFXBB_23545 [Streptomyces scopuliridis]|uniref:hypothetical protein n=1 Tax=Streptomyces scopuliridis TaxID=452529 RepID=UPI00369B0D36